MNLFRLAHKEDALRIARRPLWGCSRYAGLPFIYGFDSFAMAILGNPVFRVLGKIPPTMVMLQYRLPDHSIQVIEEPIGELYGNPSETNHFLGDWVTDFLAQSNKLVASFASRHLREQYNYIVNPRHELFESVEVAGIGLCTYPD